MAFWDMLGKTVTEASQKTIAKTIELADIARLNAMISDEEKNIANQYSLIGKLYVSVHQEDYEEEFTGMINAIAEAEAKINDYKKQIQDIKGVQRCEKCGAEVPNGAAFCSACGAAMPKAQAPMPTDPTICENCGAEVKKAMRFCTSCGKPLETITGNSVAEEATSAEKTELEKICPNCGSKVQDGVAFCTKCETNL